MKAGLLDRLTGRHTRQGLWVLPALIALAIAIVLALQAPDFLGADNVFNLVAQTMPLMITAVGQMFVVIIGGLDLSVGSLISLTTAVLALDGPSWVLIPAVFVIAALVGLTNGYVTTRLNVHPIIATLAMQYILLGVTRVLRPVAGGTVPDIVISSVAGSLFGLPMPVFWAILVILVAWKLLYGARFGLHLFAIGGGVASGAEQAARNFGIADRRNIMLAYMTCSLFAALAGVFLAGRIVSGDPNVGLLFELDAITAVAIGGTQLSGGGVILLVNYFISSGLFPGASWIFFAALALGIGTVIGLFNGPMVAKRRVSAVIATLAVSIILLGLVQFLSSGKPPGDVPGYFNQVYNTKWLAVPVPVLFWAALAILMSLFLSRTVFGRFVAAVGENATAAHFSGVPVERSVIVAHTIAGFIAGVAALVQTASIAVGSVRVGLDLPILAVAATILGGVVFGRGEGGVWGPFFGVLSFALLFVVMTVFGIPEPGKLIAQGVIILLAAILYGLRRAQAE